MHLELQGVVILAAAETNAITPNVENNVININCFILANLS